MSTSTDMPPPRSKAYNDPQVDAAMPLLLKQSGDSSPLATAADLAMLYLGSVRFFLRGMR